MAHDVPTGLKELSEFEIAWPHHSDTLRPTSRDGILLEADGQAIGEYRRVEGFRMAATLLAEHIQKSARIDESLLYPFALCWRHHLELQLKMMISVSAEMYGDKTDRHLAQSHSLGALWERAKLYIIRTFPDDQSADVRVPDRIFGQFSSIDPDGEAFRYSKRLNGRATIPHGTAIDIESFQQALTNLSSYLTAAIEGASFLADQQPDY